MVITSFIEFVQQVIANHLVAYYNLESFGCFFAMFVILGENCFWPYRLLGLRAEWDSKAINDLRYSLGKEWVGRIHISSVVLP